MKLSFIKFASLFAIVLFAFTTSCKEDEKEDDQTTTACANGASFCMKYGSTTKSGSATYIDLTHVEANRHRIYYQSGNEQVEIDVYANGAGTYSIGANSAGFEFFDGQNASSATSGSIKITNFEPTGAGLSGTFSVTMDDGTKVTDGHFINIKP